MHLCRATVKTLSIFLLLTSVESRGSVSTAESRGPAQSRSAGGARTKDQSVPPVIPEESDERPLMEPGQQELGKKAADSSLKEMNQMEAAEGAEPPKTSAAVPKIPAEEEAETPPKELEQDQADLERLEAQPDANVADEAQPMGQAPTTVVEESKGQLVAKPCDCKKSWSQAYRERRGDWDFIFAAGMSLYQPDNYQPDFATTKFKNFYGSSGTPMFESTLSLKKNVDFGSFSLDVGGGQFSRGGQFNAQLKIIPVRVGLTFAADTLFPEPYIVPYVTGGAYTGFYTETLASQKVSGNTPVSAYYAVGSRFQLDWIDPASDRSGYEDFGLENTFIYVEGRSFVASGGIVDLSSTLQLGAGLALEF